MFSGEDTDNSDDDWLFDSVKTYKNLYMYELLAGVTAMDWVTGKSVCIATSDGRKHEIAELSLPERVLSGTTEDGGLVKDRDFHMNAGGFSDNLVTSVKHIPNTRIVVTSPDVKDGHIELWQLGTQDTDMMQKISDINNLQEKGLPARLCSLPGLPDVLFGSHLDNVCLVDMETKMVKISSEGLKEKEKLGSIHAVCENTFVCCCEESGDLYVFDLRDKLSKVKVEYKNEIKNNSSYWTCCCDGDFVTEVSSDGQIKLSDRRNLDSVLAVLDSGLKCHNNKSYICVQNSRKEDKFQVSISGFDGHVYLYSLDIEEVAQSTNQIIQPIFVHEGHVRNCKNQSKPLKIVNHLLHPWQQDLILSAATDGSLHTWEFNRDFKKINKNAASYVFFLCFI